MVVLGLDDLALVLFDFGRRGFEDFHIHDVVSTVDAFDEQGQRLHGNSAPSEFLPRRTCPCRCHRYPVTGLPDARGRGSSSHPYALVRSNRNPAFGDPHFGWVLLLGAAADSDSSEWRSFPDLHRGSDSRSWSRRVGDWSTQDSDIRLDRRGPYNLDRSPESRGSERKHVSAGRRVRTFSLFGVRFYAYVRYYARPKPMACALVFQPADPAFGNCCHRL